MLPHIAATASSGPPTALNGLASTTNMALHIPTNREEVILATIHPNAIMIPTLNPLLEELRHITLLRGITLLIQTNSPPQRILGFTLLPRLEQIPRSANLVSGHLARHGQGVPVHEGDVAICRPGAREKAFELGVAALGVRFRADEHRAACTVVVGDADFFGAAPEGAFLVAPDAGVGEVPYHMVRLGV